MEPQVFLPSRWLMACHPRRLSRYLDLRPHRTFTTTTTFRAEPPPPEQSSTQKPISSLAAVANIYSQTTGSSPSTTSARVPTSSTRDLDDLATYTKQTSRTLTSHHHLYIYTHKHNSHITLTRPFHPDPEQRSRLGHYPIISVSTGNLNFRKAQRGTYDAAYQLGKYVMERIQQQGLFNEIHHLDVVFRDFGPGREALTKVLLGSEGRVLREKVRSVADATRIKFGGTRGRKPRRLG